MNNDIQSIAKSEGSDLFGVADLTPVRDAIRMQGGDWIADYPKAVSIGVRLLDSIVDQLPHRSDPGVATSYRHHCYDLVNLRLDLITSRLGSVLQTQGYRATPIPASKRVDTERLAGLFSHKLAAHLAGLGWIGKNCLLVTPEYGPRLRLATILTDAPLEATGHPMAERCGECDLCVKNCPVKAFTGRSFLDNEPREARYDAHKCDRYFSKMREKNPELAVCGMCLYVCPIGRKSPH